jgi:choline dehydrogenase-like flavoprotein
MYLTPTQPFANATASTSFASLSLVDPNLSDPEAHIHSLIASYNASHPNSDPAGRDTLLARQLLNPKEAVTQIVILPIGFDADNIPTPENLFLHDAPGNWITLGAGSTRSFSRGSVHIESSDPTKQPRIDPAYYAHPLDEDLAARCILHSANIAKAEPLYSKLKHEPNGDPVVMPKMKQKLGFGFPKTLEQAKKIVHAATATEYHPVGTCAMLPRGKGGVVDSECRVYGTANVRVVDASIFPTHVQGNIVSVVYAVAEKAADIIKGAGSTTGEKSSKGSALQGLSEKIIPAVQAVAEKLADALGSSA